MHSTFLILGGACIALLFVNSGIVDSIKAYFQLRRLKPFDCPLCLAWWIGCVIPFFLGKSFVESIYIGGIAAIAAVLIEKKLNE